MSVCGRGGVCGGVNIDQRNEGMLPLLCSQMLFVMIQSENYRPLLKITAKVRLYIV